MMPEPKLVLRAALAQAAVLFLPFLAAGTLSWRRGWIWLALQLLSLATNILLTRAMNPALLKARLENARPVEEFDRVFSQVYFWSTSALLIVAGLDARWHGSHLSHRWLYLGIVLGSLGMIPILVASCTNPYLEGFVRVQSERGHRVITSGAYSVVRHPMYAGLMLVILSWPLLFGSIWALIPAAAAEMAYPFRALHEDRVLQEHLPGYKEYIQQTPYRLFPGLW